MAEKKFVIGFKTTSKILHKDIMEIILPNKDVSSTRILMGVPKETSEDRESKNEKEPMNNAYLLSIHEHGTIDGTIPARPLLSSVIKQEKEYIDNGFEKYIKLIDEDKPYSAENQLKKMAVYLEGKLVEYFDKNNWEANAPSTIARKGSARPLIDSGDLRRSIKAFVDEGGRK